MKNFRIKDNGKQIVVAREEVNESDRYRFPFCDKKKILKKTRKKRKRKEKKRKENEKK